MEQQGSVEDKEIDAPNDTDMPDVLEGVSNSVVAIYVERADNSLIQVFSGTVLVCRQYYIYIITVSKIRDHIDNATIKVQLANSNFVTLARNNFHMDGENGIVGIRVANPPPGAVQHLAQIDFNELPIQDQQKVYTYSIAKKPAIRILTPGSIILNEKEKENGIASFDHNSAGYKFTHLGAPVLNKHGHLVGICYAYSGVEVAGYYSAYSAEAIADVIEHESGWTFTTIAAALQRLRQ